MKPTIDHSCSYHCDRPECIKAQRDEMRERLKLLDAQEPVARLLQWRGPSHYTVPHGGVVARTYTEFPHDAAEKRDSYWKNGAPLYTKPEAK